MTDPAPRRDSRLDNLAPGIPVAAKIALLLGLAGGLFLAIVLSYAHPDWQSWGLGLGIALGLAGAVMLTIRSRSGSRRA